MSRHQGLMFIGVYGYHSHILYDRPIRSAAEWLFCESKSRWVSNMDSVKQSALNLLSPLVAVDSNAGDIWLNTPEDAALEKCTRDIHPFKHGNIEADYRSHSGVLLSLILAKIPFSCLRVPSDLYARPSVPRIRPSLKKVPMIISYFYFAFLGIAWIGWIW